MWCANHLTTELTFLINTRKVILGEWLDFVKVSILLRIYLRSNKYLFRWVDPAMQYTFTINDFTIFLLFIILRQLLRNPLLCTK